MVNSKIICISIRMQNLPALKNVRVRLKLRIKLLMLNNPCLTYYVPFYAYSYIINGNHLTFMHVL